MGAPSFIEILDTLRAEPRRRRGRVYVFTDAERDRIAELAETARGGERSQEAANRALDVLERELTPFMVRP